MPQEILPPLTDTAPAAPDALGPDSAGEHAFVADPDALPPELAFDPVPQQTKRWSGITPRKQRVFIAHLAASGAVSMAARAIGVSTSALYQLRKRAGAEGFARAWERAVEMGARRVLDTLMEHAIHGVPETLSRDGRVVLERRKFNTRAMMHIAAARFPHLFGGHANYAAMPATALPHAMQQLKEEWRQEWEAERERAEEEADTARATAAGFAPDHFGGQPQLALLAMRLHAVRQGFLEDIAHDPVKRAAWDLLVGPTDWAAIDEGMEREDGEAAAARPVPAAPPRVNFHDPDMIVPIAAASSAVPPPEDPAEAAALARDEAQRRAAAEAALADPHKPFYHRRPDLLKRRDWWAGPTYAERNAARRRAEQQIDALERQWNAAYSEETWAAWKAGEMGVDGTSDAADANRPQGEREA